MKAAIARNAAETRPQTKEAVDGYQLDHSIGHLLRRGHQRHNAAFQDGIGDLQLTATQFAAMVKISQLGRVSQNQLGRMTAMDPATIQGVIQRLEARKLIARQPDPGDRRLTLLSLTADGTKLVVDAIARARKINEATLAPLQPAERQTLLTLLRKLI